MSCLLAAFFTEGVGIVISINERYINGVPILHISEKGNAEKRPALIFHHGITSAKEHNLHIAYSIAKKGFHVILPDALHHGEREAANSAQKRYLLFWNIVLQSVHELEDIVNVLALEGLIDRNQVAVGGTSMGAITSFGALSRYEWIKSGLCFMGAPQFGLFANEMFKKAEQNGIQISEKEKETLLNQIKPYDLAEQPDKLNERPLFMWHGEEDNTVPFSYARQFIIDFEKSRSSHFNKITFLPEEGVGHKVSRKAMLEAANWLPTVMNENKHGMFN